ncbi:MAG: hypothetical protein K5910_08725 [Bacteroidales bacterium]|nr:hypothetical protein [Bacteroidales bacterium]
MKNLIAPSMAVAALLLSASLLSCRKDNPDAPNTNNPPVLELSGAPFSLSVLDRERGRNPDSLYVFEGVWREGHFRFGKEQLDTMQLNLTPDNALLLSVSSEDPAFEGVNASSSSRCIDIVPDEGSRRRFRLERVGEGRTTVTLWNGTGAARQEIRFTLTARDEIPVEGILVRIDGQECPMYGDASWVSSFNGYRLGKSPSAWEPWLQQLVKSFPGRREDDWTDHLRIEVAGCIPLNATPVTITTAADGIGIIDLQAHRSELPTLIDPETGQTNHRWMRISDFYLQNLSHNPEFRWFTPLELTPDLYRDSAGGSELGVRYADDERYKYWPADLRERSAFVWCPPGAESVALAFALGEARVSSEDRGPDQPQGYTTAYDRLFQIHLDFPDRIARPIDEKWPPEL